MQFKLLLTVEITDFSSWFGCTCCMKVGLFIYQGDNKSHSQKKAAASWLKVLIGNGMQVVVLYCLGVARWALIYVAYDSL